MEKVKMAIVGCGMISDIYLENTITQFSILDVVGCADLQSEKAEKAVRPEKSIGWKLLSKNRERFPVDIWKNQNLRTFLQIRRPRWCES